MGEESDVVQQLLYFLALSTFLMMGGLEAIFLSTLRSFEYVNAGVFLEESNTLPILMGMVLGATEIGMRVALPLLGVVFLETVAMGFVSKTVPQLNVLSLGFPLRIMIGLTVMIAGLSVIDAVAAEWIGTVLDQIHIWATTPPATVWRGRLTWLKILVNKTEDATPRKILKAREDGRIAKSTDLAGALLLTFVTLLLWGMAAPSIERLGSMLEIILSTSGESSSFGAAKSLEMAGIAAVVVLAPLSVAAWLAAYVGHFWQVGWLVSPKPIEPKLEKLSPISGFKRIVGVQGLVKGAMDLGKVTIAMGLRPWSPGGCTTS